MAFEDLINVRLSGIELTLFTIVLLDRILTRDRCGAKLRLGRPHCLDRIANVNLNVLFELGPLRLYFLALDQRFTILCACGLVAEKRQIDRQPHSISRITIVENAGVRIARKHIGWYVHTLPGAAEFRSRMNTIEDSQLQWQAVSDFFEALAATTDRMPAQAAPLHGDSALA